MNLAEPFQITQSVVEVFEQLQIPYLVGGSLASSLHGIPRATQDADVVADIKTEHIQPSSKRCMRLVLRHRHVNLQNELSA